MLILITGLSACGGIKVGAASEYITNTKQGAALTIIEATPTSAVYQVTNETGSELSTGNANVIDLEVEQNGTWYQIDVGERSFTTEALLIEDGQVCKLETTWQSSYGTLPKGHYRILKGFSMGPFPSNFILSAEFEIN